MCDEVKCGTMAPSGKPAPANLCRTLSIPRNTITAAVGTLSLSAAYLISAKWQQHQDILIKFKGGTDAERMLVKSTVLESYQPYINLKLLFVDDDLLNTDIRIEFDPMAGSWSYLGTEAHSVPQNKPTMNLGWVDRAVIRHEFGHAIGPWIHEHQNPSSNPIVWDVPNVVNDLCGPPNSWDASTICRNVLDTLDEDTIRGTDYDPDSIMQYPYPASWTIGGVASPMKKSLSTMDRLWLSFTYPLAVSESAIVDYRHSQELSSDAFSSNTQSYMIIGIMSVLVLWFGFLVWKLIRNY
jgi:hypothetical protein